MRDSIKNRCKDAQWTAIAPDYASLLFTLTGTVLGVNQKDFPDVNRPTVPFPRRPCRQPPSAIAARQGARGAYAGQLAHRGTARGRGRRYRGSREAPGGCGIAGGDRRGIPAGLLAPGFPDLLLKRSAHRTQGGGAIPHP